MDGSHILSGSIASNSAFDSENWESREAARVHSPGTLLGVIDLIEHCGRENSGGEGLVDHDQEVLDVRDNDKFLFLRSHTQQFELVLHAMVCQKIRQQSQRLFACLCAQCKGRPSHQ